MYNFKERHISPEIVFAICPKNNLTLEYYILVSYVYSKAR